MKKMTVVTREDSLFLEEAKKAFTSDETLSTYRNNENTHIALRTSGVNVRDSIMIFKIEEVAEFEGVLTPGKPLTLEN